jgi:hypothetical protein
VASIHAHYVGGTLVKRFQMADEYQERKRLTFEQAEGAEPLPAQLKIGEISGQLRAALWAVFYESFQGSVMRSQGGYTSTRPYFVPPWSQILYDKHVHRDHEMADEFDSHYDAVGPGLKAIFENGDYIEVFGLVQWVLRHPNCPYGLPERVERALTKSRAAYRLIEARTIVPIASAAEGKTIERALADVSTSEFRGARTHLLTAAAELTNGNYPGSVRESIHAVESVARVLDPASNTLAPALATLEKSIRLHPALKTGFGNLYGYTSDEKGVRHALLNEGAPQVTEGDALYMLGSCAAFVSYLINKAQTSGLLKKKPSRSRASAGT